MPRDGIGLSSVDGFRCVRLMNSTFDAALAGTGNDSWDGSAVMWGVLPYVSVASRTERPGLVRKWMLGAFGPLDQG